MIDYDVYTFPSGVRRKYLPDRKFNRKTFNPLNDDTDRAILRVLRQIGINRYMYFRYRNGFYASTSLRYLMDSAMSCGENKGEAYIDFGCGESGDRFIAHRLGYQSVGMDLFPPMFTEQETKSPGFIIGDIAEPLPFADFQFTYATCHAVIALLQRDERARFYQEVYRCMKIGGVFVLTGAHLKNGYGFDLDTERYRLLKSTDFDYVRTVASFGVAVQKN
jgi:SAM-dependent methyltransferase